MWFRLAGGGGGGGGTTTTTTSGNANSGSSEASSGRGNNEGDIASSANNIAASDTVPRNGNETVTEAGKKAPREASKFEKFRRASFRRKSSTSANGSANATRKRSKSPHALLQLGKSFSSVEEEINEDEQRTNDKEAALKLLLSTTHNEVKTKPTQLKPIKTDPPKRKFYKFASMRRQNSDEKQTPTSEKNDAIAADIHKKNEVFKKLPKIDDSALDSGNNDENELSIDSTDDDDDIGDDDKDECNERCSKNKILLTDPKFKHNRIEKSSSKTKIGNVNNISTVAGDKLEKRESIKRSRSARKISAPPILIEDNSKNKKNNAVNNKKPEKESRSRTQAAHLNLQALVKFVVSNKKFLNTEDFALIRRKSISEAASTMIAVAACKPLPIALKYPTEHVVAEAPKENDAKAERNVVLVKKQNLSNSFCDHLNSSSNSNNNCNNSDACEQNKQKSQQQGGVRVRKASDKESLKKGKCTTKAEEINAKVKRNSSNSSKSSGNFEDEAFYSCDELEAERLKLGLAEDKIDEEQQTEMRRENSVETASDEKKRKSSSPSLTSRVAAKINETTNIYKNRRAAKSAKKRKNQNNAGDKRPELYKQISVERLHSSPIVRQPSDRRPDAASLRANSSASAASHNSSDVQSSFHESRDAGAGLESSFAAGGGTTASGSAVGGMSGAMGTSMDVDHSSSAGMGAGTTGNDANALDVEGKDARRERLQQQHLQNKSAPVSVNRSESYKERLSNKRNRSRRKTSDPSLTSRPNDEHADLGLSNSNYTASSNSSLSSGGGSESPSTSMEQVANAATSAQHHHHHAHSSSMHGHHGVHHAHQHSHQDSFHSSSGGSTGIWGGSNSGSVGNQLTRQFNFDTDEEDELNEADWSSLVAADMLAALTDAEKKRQEIINEIYQTERSHVRTLTLLERLFFCPLQSGNVLSPEDLALLFPPALLSLRELHSAFEHKLKQRRVEHNHVVQHVGDLLAHMFDGQSGEELREYAAQFCARQQIALEALKEKRRKDEQLQKLLSKAESHKACRRLQLKDLLPTVLQRLTKYPLLFENLYKMTVRVLPENMNEAEAIQRALESSKKILVDVNQAVKTAEDAHKLQNIQRKLDKSTFDKDEFKKLDLTQFRLIFDGNLALKKCPSTQLHGLLFEDMIMLLTKQDDKYSLKYLQQHTTGRNNEVNSKPVSPIMNIVDTIARQDAADKNSFFLIKTKTSQMLELRAPSSSESKTWFKHITDAAEQYKRSKHATSESVDDPAIVTIPHSNTKESLELTSERAAPIAATATVTITPLAPMIPPPTVTAVATAYITPSNNDNNANHNHGGSNDSLGGVQLRHNSRRESTPTHTVSTPPAQAAALHQQQQHQQQQQQSQQQQQQTKVARHSLTPSTLNVNSTPSPVLLSPVVNRTMSTRSCGDTPTSSHSGGVTLRHTQSARQANAQDAAELCPSRRDSNSIVYAHNPNNTRTLLQTAPPLIDPSAVQISITPVHICETPAERLRRLDGNIREGLLEKQRIICDMFRLPVEHFHEIVDIAAMPEAPKDSADIALAAYAQVQSLTEVLNEYLQITPAQESAAISANNSNGCAQCHDKQKLTSASNSSSSSSSVTPVTVSEKITPPPLPPPNKQQATAQTATAGHKQLTPIGLEQSAQIHEDDDGYCEIDELRLPALPTTLAAAVKDKSVADNDAPPPLPPPAGTFKTPPPPPPLPPSNAVKETKQELKEAATTTTAELTKRQSTVSADSIPEESAEDITRALAEDNDINKASEANTNALDKTAEAPESKSIEEKQDANEPVHNIDATDANCCTKCSNLEESNTSKPALIDVDTQTTLSLCPNNVVNTNTTTIITIGTNNNNSTAATATYEKCSHSSTLNGPIRIQHANNIEPSVPCHALSSIVCALNTHISLLLPTINERDLDRERLRKENKRLRDKLNAMQREVEAKMETPTDITLNSNATTVATAPIAAAEDECDGSAVASSSSNGPTTIPAANTVTNDSETTNTLTTTANANNPTTTSTDKTTDSPCKTDNVAVEATTTPQTITTAETNDTK